MQYLRLDKEERNNKTRKRKQSKILKKKKRETQSQERKINGKQKFCITFFLCEVAFIEVETNSSCRGMTNA